jgi:hypothetical protein
MTKKQETNKSQIKIKKIKFEDWILIIEIYLIIVSCILVIVNSRFFQKYFGIKKQVRVVNKNSNLLLQKGLFYSYCPYN